MQPAEATNPYTSGLYFVAIVNGSIVDGVVQCTDCGWNPFDSPWCQENHTTALGNRYHHAHVAGDFPVITVINGIQTSITAQMVKDYWNIEAGPNAVAVSAATFKYNCHGFTLGKTIFIEPVFGVGYILNDEFKPSSLMDGGKYVFSKPNFWEVEHSYKVQSVCSPSGCTSVKFMRKRVKKWNSSPVYETSYDCGDAVGVESNFRVMKPVAGVCNTSSTFDKHGVLIVAIIQAACSATQERQP